MIKAILVLVLVLVLALAVIVLVPLLGICVGGVGLHGFLHVARTPRQRLSLQLCENQAAQPAEEADWNAENAHVLLQVEGSCSCFCVCSRSLAVVVALVLVLGFCVGGVGFVHVADGQGRPRRHAAMWDAEPCSPHACHDRCDRDACRFRTLQGASSPPPLQAARGGRKKGAFASGVM